MWESWALFIAGEKSIVLSFNFFVSSIVSIVEQENDFVSPSCFPLPLSLSLLTYFPLSLPISP